MNSTHDFEPDWYSPPGETITDVLRDRALSEEEFRLRMGMTTDQVRDLVDGRAAITDQLAQQLAQTLGSTPRFWMTREEQYRADLDRFVRRSPAQPEREWLQELPLADMVKFGWIPKVTSTADKVLACLRFFGIPTLEAWTTRREVAVAFRTSAAFESRPGAVATWLRRGEIENGPHRLRSVESGEVRTTLTQP